MAEPLKFHDPAFSHFFRKFSDGTEQRFFISKLKAGTAIFRCLFAKDEVAVRAIDPSESIIGEVTLYEEGEEGKCVLIGTFPLRAVDGVAVMTDTITLPNMIEKDLIFRTMTTIFPPSKTKEA